MFRQAQNVRSQASPAMNSISSILIPICVNEAITLKLTVVIQGTLEMIVQGILKQYLLNLSIWPTWIALIDNLKLFMDFLKQATINYKPNLTSGQTTN